MTTVSIDDVAQPLRMPESKKGGAAHSLKDSVKFALELAQQGKAGADVSKTSAAGQNPLPNSLWSETLLQVQDQSQNAVLDQGQDKNAPSSPDAKTAQAAIASQAVADNKPTSSALFSSVLLPNSPRLNAAIAPAQIIPPVVQSDAQSGNEGATSSDVGQNPLPISQNPLSQSVLPALLWPESLPQGQNPIVDQGQGKNTSSFNTSSFKDTKSGGAAIVSQIAAADSPALNSTLFPTTVQQKSPIANVARGHASKTPSDGQRGNIEANLPDAQAALPVLTAPMAIAVGSGNAGADNSLNIPKPKLTNSVLDVRTSKDVASADRASMALVPDDGVEAGVTPVTLLARQLKNSEQGQRSANQDISSAKPQTEIAVVDHATHLPVDTHAGHWLQETVLSSSDASSSAAPVDGAAQTAQDTGVSAPQLDLQRSAMRTLDLALTGQDLGPLSVKMRLRGDRLNVDISSTRADSVSAMMRDHSVLSEALVGAGYQLDSLNMQVSTPVQPQSGGVTTSSGQGQAPRQQEGRPNSTVREQNDEKQNQSAGTQAASPVSPAVSRSSYYI